MIVKMKKYVFLVYHKHYTDFLEKLREVGVLHVAEKAEGIADNDQLRDKMQLSAKIKKTLTEATPFLLPNTTPQEVSTYEGAELLKTWDALQAEKNRLQQIIATTQKEAERMQVWGKYDSEKLAKLAKDGYVLQFFCCPKRNFQTEWESDFNTFIINEIGSNLYFVTVNHTAITLDAEAVTLNARNSEQLQLDVEAQNLLLTAHQAKMEAWVHGNFKNLENFALQVEETIDFQKVELNTTPEAEEKVMLLEGFCPQANEEKLNAMLEAEGVYYKVFEPKIDEDVPIKLKNNFFTKLFEPITELYSLPNYNEIDLTPYLAPFFMLFFGLCLGDGGYGLLILIAATIVKYKFPKFKSVATLAQFLGGATVVVGLLTGMFFGISLESVTWPWLANVKNYFITSNNYAAKLGGYDPMMVVAVVVGLFQILFAMGLKVVKTTIQFGFKYAAADCAWLIIILDGLALLLPVLGIALPQTVLYVLYGIAAVCAFVILFYNSPGKNPFVNLGSGLWGTYGTVSGLLGDVLSYIRLFALGLAGGILGGVFNMLAISLTADMSPFVRWLPMLFILLFGHSLNILLCIISSIVHPLRLTFVEFYKNAGFEGGGHPYKPFKTKTTKL